MLYVFEIQRSLSTPVESDWPRFATLFIFLKTDCYTSPYSLQRATYNIKGFLQKQKKNAAKKIKKKTTLAVTNQCIPIYSVAAA